MAELYAFEFRSVADGAYTMALPAAHPQLLQSVQEARVALGAADEEAARSVRPLALPPCSFVLRGGIPSGPRTEGSAWLCQ